MRSALRSVLLALALSPRLLPAQSTAVDVVKQLYAAYAWETSDSEATHQTPLFAERPPILARYLDAPLLKAVLRDRACKEKSRGICNLDFEPMWDSQDPGGATVDVVPTRDAAVVQARIHYPSDHSTRIVRYRMRRTPQGWRIADMAGAQWPSLVHLLRSPAP